MEETLAKAAVGVVKQLEPRGEYEHDQNEAEHHQDAHHQNSSVTYRYTVEQTVERHDDDGDDQHEETQTRKRRWWQCGCFK